MSEDFNPTTAVEWKIALSEEPDDPVLGARFDAWLAAAEDHRTEWRDLTRGLENFRQVGPLYREKWVTASGGGQNAALQRGRLKRRSASFVRVSIVAFAVAAAVTVVCAPDLLLRLQADYVTGTAETRTVDLSDGSQLILAPRSAVKLSYSVGKRDIRLLKGEALFTVRHDMARPFEVHTDKLTVTDIGTIFDVRLARGEEEVSVREGEVRVRDVSGGFHDLDAGTWERIRTVGNGVSVTHGSRAPDDVGAWSAGQIIAKENSVSSVVDRLRPYYRGVVVLCGSSFGEKSLTGVYDARDPVGAFRAIAAAHQAQMHQVSPWLTILAAP